MRRLMMFSTLLLVVLLMAVPGLAAQDDAGQTQSPAEICAANTPAPEPETVTFEAAEDVLEDGVDYSAVFCTSAGAVYVDLFEEQTPITVNNFVFLAQQNYYNNTRFHRVIDAFMAQGGDPTNTGTGGPGYQFEDEFVDDLRFDEPGLLAMANAGPGTNGSQFFITTSEPEHLNDAHTIFGEVLSGYENVQQIAIRDPQSSFFPGTSLNTVVIITDPASVDAEATDVPAATVDEAQALWDTLSETVPAALEDFGPGFSALFAYDQDASGVFNT
ncbi:MAG: peptidylprolyl isomerase, partial [Anaerolineales bacterium]